MTNNPDEGPGGDATPGQPPMGGGHGGSTGPGDAQYGATPGGPNPSKDGQSPLAKVFDSRSDLPSAVRQTQLAALASAAGFLVMHIITIFVTSAMLSGQAPAFGVISPAGAGIAGGIVSLIIGLGLYALVVIPLLGRKNWGRILGIVFAILGGLGGLINLVISISFFTLDPNLAFVLLLHAIIMMGTAIWYLVFAFQADVAIWYTPQQGHYVYPPAYSQSPYGPGGPGQAPPPGPHGGYGAGPQRPEEPPYGGPHGPGAGGLGHEPGGPGPKPDSPSNPPN